MIFVTVGTHEQQFDRLIKEVDYLKKNKFINEDVFIQTGFSEYIPQYCQHSKFLSYEEMTEYIENARIIITHGGPASFLSVLSAGKSPIIVPRQEKYGEHVNDHQVDFSTQLIERGYPISVVYNIDELPKYLSNTKPIEKTFVSHNNTFINNLRKELENWERRKI